MFFTKTNSPWSGSYQDLTYQFDNGGNLTGITDALWTASRSFAYDDLNRLTSATGNFGSNLAQVTQNYAYDAIGNILNKAGVLYYYCNHPQQPAASQYCGGPLHPSAVVNTSDGNVYTYDNNGNTWTGAGRDITWTADNRVASVTAPGGSADMVYDHTGIRVKKSGSSGTTYFPFAGYEVTGNVYTKYIRVGNETLAANRGGEKRFYHNDHLGGVNVITDIFAVRCQLTEYDPWGSVSRQDGNCDPTHRFTGKELDPESGLYYYGGRYYDQQISRFISPDPYVQAPANPQNFNRYSYTINNPQIYIDPSGYEYGESGGSYSIPLYGWVKFFMDLSASDHNHHERPRPKYRGAATPPHAQLAKNRGHEGKLENVLVYDSQGSGGGENGGWQGGIRTVAAGGDEGEGEASKIFRELAPALQQIARAISQKGVEAKYGPAVAKSMPTGSIGWEVQVPRGMILVRYYGNLSKIDSEWYTTMGTVNMIEATGADPRNALARTLGNNAKEIAWFETVKKTNVLVTRLAGGADWAAQVLVPDYKTNLRVIKIGR